MGRFGVRWMRLAAVGAAGVVGVALLATTASGARQDARPPVLKAGNPSGIVFAHGNNPQSGTSSNLIYHGGAVMSTPASAIAIFWGSSWSSSPGDKITGIDTFYQGVGGSKYLGTATEYTDNTGKVYNGLTYVTHDLYTSAAPRKAPSTSEVLSAVATALSMNHQTPAQNGYYPVYSDQPRGHANYCAWHSWGTIGTTLVQFAFFFNLDGDPGCDPQDTSHLHSQGLAALANVSGHELSEMVTDRHGDAWYDSRGAENADKCAWTFGKTLLTFHDGTQWKIQGNWSNAVASAGGTLSYNHTGCIDGN